MCFLIGLFRNRRPTTVPTERIERVKHSGFTTEERANYQTWHNEGKYR